MFVVTKQEIVSEAQSRALNAPRYCKKTRNGSRGINSCLNVPRYRFLQRVKCGYEMAWNHPKHEFLTEIVDWACSLWQNKKWFRKHKLVHLMHPILIFIMGLVWQWNGVKPPETWVLDVKYVVRNQTDVVEQWNGVQIPKIWVLDIKEYIKIFQVVCLESYYSETFNQMHANTSFRNRSGASTKWHETFENMSFRPKLWIEHVRCDQTRNGFRGTNSCFKCTPILQKNKKRF